MTLGHEGRPEGYHRGTRQQLSMRVMDRPTLLAMTGSKIVIDICALIALTVLPHTPLSIKRLVARVDAPSPESPSPTLVAVSGVVRHRFAIRSVGASPYSILFVAAMGPCMDGSPLARVF